MSAKLISIIGPPAAGKTTLAETLAQLLPAKLIREDYAGNPFLAESYVGDERTRLPGQLYFLLSRAGQLAAGRMPEAGAVVSDYGFCQDRLYAQLRLASDDLKIYEKIASRVEAVVHRPDMLICLDASADSLLDRIADRGRVHESALTAGLLENMRREYDKLSAELGCPAIRVDTDGVDIRDSANCRRIVEQVRSRI